LTQAAIAKKYREEQLPEFLSALEALLKQNKNGDGFFVGDKVMDTRLDKHSIGRLLPPNPQNGQNTP